MAEHRATTTQTRHPWRATVRTVFAVVVGLATLVPDVVAAGGFDPDAPAVARVVAVAGAITRILAIPSVEAFLRQFAPWLAAGDRSDDA